MADSMPDDFGLPREAIEKMISVFRAEPKIQKVVIYGSRAKGNFKPGSDIDLTIVGPKMDLTGLLRVETNLDELLLPYKMDLSLFHQIKDESVLKHIESYGQVFFIGSR